ncbi:MAG: translation elongation factor 4 [Bacillota bacterium]
MKNIRNFCIIAHIDHGKSTLADRLLEFTKTLDPRQMEERFLDQMELEKERGITIKAKAVRLHYQARDGQEYILNLIDTPGHVDFTYEVSRSLAACEGALLVVDAAQGIEAQTLANVYLALEHNLEIIPVINKIDLPAANPNAVRQELAEVIGLDPGEAIEVSAKLGTGIEEVLEAIVQRIPAPRGDREAPLQALIFDSHFDSYKGVIAYVRVVEGALRRGQAIRMMATGRSAEVAELGIFVPSPLTSDSLEAGEVGYVAAGIKTVKDCRVGDTITDSLRPADKPLPGYRAVKPMVFCGLYPVESSEYDLLRDALDKLKLNDASLHYEPESSAALGFGYRCGFLGLLHMDIVRERLEREYKTDLITTAPNVVYRVTTTDGQVTEVENPAKLPGPDRVQLLEEPYVKAQIFLPADFIGPVMELAKDRRGIFSNMEYLNQTRVALTYEFPLAEIMYDFFDNLKSRTKGYASLDYEFIGYREGDMVKVDILVNGEPVDALSFVTHRSQAQYRGRQMVERLRSLIPRQMFEVPVQAAVGSKIVARESVRAYRKDVLAKCYGGDVTRKRKLLEKQKEGKKRMKQVGSVEIPQEAFMAILKIE